MTATVPAAYLLVNRRTGAVVSRHRTEKAAERAGYKADPSGSFVVTYGRLPVGADATQL